MAWPLRYASPYLSPIKDDSAQNYVVGATSKPGTRCKITFYHGLILHVEYRIENLERIEAVRSVFNPYSSPSFEGGMWSTVQGAEQCDFHFALLYP